MKRTHPRRDICYAIGHRASLLPAEEARVAWRVLAIELEAMGTLDMPKFKHLLRAIRHATIKARQEVRERESQQ